MSYLYGTNQSITTLRYLLFVFFVAISCTSLFAQGLAGERNLGRGIINHFSYGPVTTAGDLADRFSGGFSIGLAVDYTPADSPWLFGVMGHYVFGNSVKEDVANNLRLPNGAIIGNQREVADLRLRMRAYFLGVRASRIIAFGENKRSGIKIGVGVGYLGHRIRFQEDVTQSVNQLNAEYRKGYDRLTGGPALYQFFGYQLMSRNGRINFFAGGELIEGFTTSLRDFDFATAGSLEGSRLDILAGFRAGIILPLYFGEGQEIFYR